MSDAKLIMFDNRLKKVYRILQKQAKQLGVFCYRLYDRDLPEFPLIIDVYGENVLVTEYRSNHRLSEEDYDRWLEDSLEVVRHVMAKSEDQLYLKERKRKESKNVRMQETLRPVLIQRSKKVFNFLLILLEIRVGAERHRLRRFSHARFLIVGDPLLKEIILALQRNALHKREGIRNVPDFRIS